MEIGRLLGDQRYRGTNATSITLRDQRPAVAVAVAVAGLSHKPNPLPAVAALSSKKHLLARAPAASAANVFCSESKAPSRNVNLPHVMVRSFILLIFSITWKQPCLLP